MNRAQRSISCDYQDSVEPYSTSVIDDFYRGRASGGFFGSDSFSDGSSSNGEYPQQRTSPRRATSPLSFGSFGPRSPLATMFAFDPLDDLPEVGIREEDQEETKEEEDALTGCSNGVSDHPPALLQTMSPPVSTEKWVPRFLRNRSSATPVAPPAEERAPSPPSEAMPAPTAGRWVPPNQREGFTARPSIDSYPLATRESFSDNLFFEDTNSYSIGDEVHGVTSLIGVRKSMEDVCSCIPDLNSHLGDSGFHQKQSIYMLFDGHSGARVSVCVCVFALCGGSLLRQLTFVVASTLRRRQSSPSNDWFRTCALMNRS